LSCDGGGLLWMVEERDGEGEGERTWRRIADSSVRGVETMREVNSIYWRMEVEDQPIDELLLKLDGDAENGLEEEYTVALVFDTTGHSVSTRPIEDLDGAGVGECITLDGRLITVLSLHVTKEEAEEEARTKADEMSCVMNTDVRHSMENEGTGNTSETMEDSEEIDDFMDERPVEDRNIDRYDFEDTDRPIDYENQDAIRTLFEVMYNELNEDVRRMAQESARINLRQARLRRLMDQYLGGPAANGVLDAVRLPARRILPMPFPSATGTWRPKRPRHSFSDDEDEDWEVEGEEELVPKRKNSYAIQPSYPPLPSYPFVSMEEELECISESNGSASEYARRLARILFRDSLNLYFKDQDAKRRQWIHQAVDMRFPSRDRHAQASKWKNCSGAINKNRVSEDSPGPATSREIDYIYVTKEEEEEAFNNCHQDATKYAELLGMKLFEDTIDRMFRDQDAVKKEWLRECVDIRFPIGDKTKRDGRWKVCASAVNRNRNKFMDSSTGGTIAYPYISQEIEEKCFSVAKDNVALYAELLGRLLFKSNRDLMFKDQDPKKRQWVHDIVDSRYPTPDKQRHAAKWKTCSSAINKARFTAEYPMPWDHKHNARTSLPNGTTTSIPSTTRAASVAAASTTTPASRTLLPKRTTSSDRAKKRTGLPYPFISEDEEFECYTASKSNVQTYARLLARILFKDSLELYFKDQDPKRREWFKVIIEHRYPTTDRAESVQKWKNISGAVNKNRDLAKRK
ncbi:hypothetical protein PMAYCL1PPCAC_21008, partial [Pristionchus mayeri]